MMIPINDSNGKTIAKENDVIAVLITGKDACHYTKKLEIKKYREAIQWMNE